MDFGFPPFGAQWERGPSGFLKDGVGAIPHQMPSRWSDILVVFAATPKRTKSSSLFLLCRSRVMKMQESAISGILKTFLKGRKNSSKED